jgi:predicted amidohydrolase YtcJ
MAAPADAIYVDGQVRTLGSGEPVEALAVRDGRCCRLADTYEVEFLEGIETDHVDLAGRIVLPGFEAHVDLLGFGQRLVSDGRGTDQEAVVEPPAPGTIAEARDYVDAALNEAARRGVTTLHATVGHPLVARAAWDRDALPVRLRLHYVQRDAAALSDTVRRLGLVSGAGGPRRSIETIGVRVATAERPAGRQCIAPDGIPDFLGAASDAGFGVTLHAMDDRALAAAIEGLVGHAPGPARLITDVPPAPEQIQELEGAGIVVVLGPAAWSTDAAPVDQVQDPGRQLRFSTGHFDVDPLGLLDGLIKESGTSTTTALRLLTGTPEDTAGIALGEPGDFVVLSGSLQDQPLAGLDVDLTVSDGRVVAGSA